MRRLIKFLLRKAGFEIHRSATRPHLREPFIDQQSLLNHLAVAKPVIFDVGAYHGDTVSRYRAAFPNAVIHCFEPSPLSFDALQNRFLNDSNVVILNLAIGERVETRELFVNYHDATNSLLRRPTTGKKYYDKEAVLKETINVPVTSLDSYMHERGISRCDLLKMDIQGSELSALRGAAGMLHDRPPPIIYIEVNFMPHYEQQPLLPDLWSFLACFDYTLFNLYELQTAQDGQVRFGDALFIHQSLRAEALEKSEI